MIESSPDAANKIEKGDREMIDKKVLDKIRQALIDSLENSIKTYTRNGTQEWVNEANCRKLIEELKAKRPIRVGGPFWGQHMGAVIQEHGFPDSGLTWDEHFEIWKRIEKGE